MPTRRPLLTAFIGRQRDLAELRELAARTRLLTITGPGGIGKSRLVSEVLADRHSVFVRLDGIRDGGAVASEVAAALGVRVAGGGTLEAAVLERLRREPCLLVLDPCEHLLESTAAFVSDVLAASDGVRVVAVSRQALGLEGEVVRRVGGLGRDESVALLLDRASLAGAAVDADADRPALEALSERLDGMPLALELAATRLAVLSPAQIVDRLGDRFQLLRRGEQTLLATVGWSYDLLSDDERRAFRMLSAFQAPFDLAASERVAGASLDLMAALVEKSLVQVVRHPAGPARYFLLDTLRHFAVLKLHEAGEVDVAMRGLTEWTDEIIRASEPPRPSTNQYFDLLNENHANLTAALEWASVNSPELLASIAARSWFYFYRSGRFAEGLRWLRQAVAVRAADPAVRVLALMGTGGLVAMQELGSREALEYVEEAVREARAGRDLDLLRRTLGNLALRHWQMGQRERALEGWLEVSEMEGGTPLSPYNRATFLNHLGSALLAVRGDEAGAESSFREALAVARAADITLAEITTLTRLAELERRRRRPAAARRLLAEAVRLYRRRPEPTLRLSLFGEAAAVAADAGRHSDALRLWGAALLSEPESIGNSFHMEHAAAVATACRTLGAAADEELAAGRALATEAVLTLIEEGGDDKHAAGPLTERQLEVARLVAEGLSNREIAARLFITERGAEGHVERIRERLGFSTRSQIAAWFVEMGYLK